MTLELDPKRIPPTQAVSPAAMRPGGEKDGNAPLIQDTGWTAVLVSAQDARCNCAGGMRAPKLEVLPATGTDSTGTARLNCLLSAWGGRYLIAKRKGL